MDEELNQILTNEEMDANARAEAIKSLIGKDYIPVAKHTEKIKKEHENFKNLQNEYNSYKATKMTDEEKQEELLRVEKEKAEKNNRMLSQLFAENVFSKAGFVEDDYKELIPDILKEDPETTKAIAEKICKTMVRQKENIENRIKEDIIKGQKKPEGGNGNQEEKTNLEKYKKAYEIAEKNNDKVGMATYTMLISQELKK